MARSGSMLLKNPVRVEALRLMSLTLDAGVTQQYVLVLVLSVSVKYVLMLSVVCTTGPPISGVKRFNFTGY